MNHCVPDWDLEDAPIPSSSGFSRAVDKKTAMPDDELVELLWRNGQVVMQSQTQRYLRKSPVIFSGENDVLPGRPEKFISDHREDIESATNHLFIQEDEMASWLHYPLDDSFEREFCPDLFNPIHGSTPGNFSGGRNHQIGAERRAVSDPPIGGKDKAVAAVAPANTEKMVSESSRPLNLLHFSLPAMNKRGFPAEAKAEVSRTAARESRVDPNEIPAMGSGNYSSFLPESRVSGGELRGISASAACDVSVNVSGVEKVRGEVRMGGVSKRVVTETEFPTCDTIEATFTSSSRGSGGSGDRNINSAADDRKRKAREADESECQSEDMEFESMDPKKAGRQSTSTRRTRAAEVHNLSERRRRDRINEKMKALQELIPRSNKSDKASMLDEVIEYLKSLQLQVQMMSMGCSMPPIMFPGVQHYMPSMSLGMGMGMSMDMGIPVGLNRPILSFPQVLPNSAMPGSAPPHLAPRIPMTAFHLPSISQADQSQVQPTNRLDPALNFVSLQNLNQMQMPNFVDPYQHYLHTMHVPPPQNQVPARPSSGKGAETPNNNSG